MTELEKNVLSDISVDNAWSLVETFSTMVREHPDDVNAAADVLVERLQSHGVPVTVHEPELYLSLPIHAEVRAGGTTFRAKAPSMSADARDGVEAELVYVPAGYAAGSDDIFDLDMSAAEQVDVEGKIVISEGYANPANVAEFEAWGAVGVIAINPGIDIHWGTCTTVWGIPGLSDLPNVPTIPAVAVNKPDGEKLKALAQEGATVTVVAEMEIGWFKSKIPEVRIEGSEEPDRFVLLHGHYDSWDVGVGDNATGDATLMEIARVLHKHKGKLKRSVRIAWWPGHSTGRYAGSTWYADQFAIDLHEQCVAQVNCDSPGCRWATEYKDVSLTAETAGFAGEVIREVAGKELHAERAHQAGDYSFNNIGISSYFMLLSTMPDDLREEKGYYAVGGCGGNIAWHTENDTMEIADRDILETDIGIYLLSVLRNANVEMLPFDWRATASEFLATLDDYQSMAGDLFDLGPAKTAAKQLASSLDTFYRDIEAGSVEVDAANDAIMELARILIPINFTTQGAFRHDPALTIPRLPDIAPACDLADLPDDVLGFAKTDLVRGQNRVVSALRQATRRVELVAKQTAQTA